MSSPAWTSDLAARYELLEEAGRGGMGVVYKATDRETGEIVALKILKPEIAADRAAAERFINEVRLSRRITHKNVCRVYEFSRAGSTAYLSMEFVEGESLRAILERMGAVTVRKGTQIARQMCAALHEAHSQGIIHRDLKPENVMLDRAGNVKVMDFGIARLLDPSVTSTGGVIGTPAYMAPEQAEGRDIDARTDIYATGLILYELFTGRPTFTGDTAITIALKQIRETPPAPRTHDASIPPELDALVLTCLAAAVDRVHPDYLALVVANRVLGAGPTGRLFLNLRERRGITYGVYSVLAAYKHGGDWRAYGDMNAERNAEAIDALLDELRRIAGEPVPAAELDSAKRSIVAGFAVTLEQLSQRVAYLSNRRSYGLSADYWDRYPERIMAISPDDVLRAPGSISTRRASRSSPSAMPQSSSRCLPPKPH